ALQRGQRIAELVAGGIAAAGVVVFALAAEALEAEVGGQHQRRHHRAPSRIAVDAGAHRARRRRGDGTGAAHAPPPRSAARRIASTRAGSFRNASWPNGERRIRSRPGFPSPSTSATESPSGTSRSPSTATTVVGTSTA